MIISKEQLIEKGYEERQVNGQTVYVKGHQALIYMFNAWLPCYYGAGTYLADRLCINTMEELEALE